LRSAPGIYSHLVKPELSDREKAELERVIAKREAELDRKYRDLSSDLMRGAFEVQIKTSNDTYLLRGDKAGKRA
jgi:hypothetical protein